MTVLEGEVVEVTTDVEVRVAALRDLPAESQVHAVTVMLSDARTRLLAASAVHDLPGIREIKACAATLQEIAKQLRLGKDMQLEAAEFVRRAERAIGVGIRDGQRNGTVLTDSEVLSNAAIRRDIKLGRSTKTSEELVDKSAPTDFAERGELSGNACKGQFGIFGMTDDVTDEQFEQALAEARDEGQLSRANVARKARARARGESPPPPPAPKVRKTARARKLIAHMSIDLHNYALAVAELDFAEVDAAEAHTDIMHMFNSIGVIRSFLKKVNKQI